MISLDNQKFLETDERNSYITYIINSRIARGVKKIPTRESLKRLTDYQILGAYREEQRIKERQAKNKQTNKEPEVKAKNDYLEWAKYLEKVKKNLEKAQEKYGHEQISIDDKEKTKPLSEERRKLYQEIVDGTFYITDIHSKETQNLIDAEKWEILQEENEKMRKRAQELLDMDNYAGGRKR